MATRRIRSGAPVEASSTDPWLTESADELHRLLVFQPMVKNLTGAQDAYELFVTHHEREADQSPASALLMVTDRRWRKVAGTLMIMIDESGLLDDDVVAGFAQTFVAANDAVYWTVPANWFDGGPVFELTPVPIGRSPVRLEEEADATSDSGPTVARRDVWPTLRRWAAARVVRRNPANWAGVRSRAKKLPSAPAAAVMCGLLDAVSEFPPPVRDHLLDEALEWPHSSVRLAALRRILERDGAAAACARGATDRDAEIRRWADSLNAAAATSTQEGLF